MPGREQNEPVSTPIDAVLTAVRASVPGARVRRLVATHPADDDNVWFIRTSGAAAEVQIDSHPDGEPPFLIEDDQHGQVTTLTIQEAVEVIERWLLAAQ